MSYIGVGSNGGTVCVDCPPGTPGYDSRYYRPGAEMARGTGGRGQVTTPRRVKGGMARLRATMVKSGVAKQVKLPRRRGTKTAPGPTQQVAPEPVPVVQPTTVTPPTDAIPPSQPYGGGGGGGGGGGPPSEMEMEDQELEQPPTAPAPAADTLFGFPRWAVYAGGAAAVWFLFLRKRVA